MKIQNEPLSVLIVDDEPLIRFTLSIFIMKNTEPRTVDSAEKAFDEIEAHHYNLCFIDYNMSGMTGLEAMKIIKERSEKTKVVIMSESYFDLDEDIKKQIGESAYAFVEKPFELSQIMELIKCAEGGQPELNEQVETIG